MELEEMKNAWLQIDERLKKQEILRVNMLRDMLNTKMTMALGKLKNFEVIGQVLLLFISPLLIYVILLFHRATPTSLAALKTIYLILTLLYIVALGVCLFIVSSFWKIRLLEKMNSTESLLDNANSIQHYKSYIQSEKKFTLVFLLICTLSVLIELYLFSKTGYCTFLSPLLISVSFVCFIWQYKVFYKSNIDTIVSTLSELKELEADTDELPPVPPTNIDI